MSGADDFVWRGWELVASMFDPLGRTVRLPSLRETRRHACLLADGLGDAAKGPASESSPVSVMSQPQKLPAKASAAAPIIALPTDLLAKIAAQHLSADQDAPLAASVCSGFGAVQWSAVHSAWDVRAPGAALQGLLRQEPSIVPAPGGHQLLLQQLGGCKLTEFQPFWAFDSDEEKMQNPGSFRTGCRRVLHSDMQELLDLDGSGWLHGHVLDCYFNTFVQSILTAQAGTEDVYLPSQVLNRLSDGFPDLMSYVLYKEVLDAAARFHGVLNLPQLHFAYFHVVKRRQCLVIFESSTLIYRSHGRKLLVALALLLDTPGMCNWDVFVLRNKAGVPKQLDGKSCGVYSCIIGQHVLQKRIVPCISSPQCILEWRAHIAKVLMESPKAFAF